MKTKEDTFEIEKNLINADNQSLKRKICILEKDLESLNFKVIVLNIIS